MGLQARSRVRGADEGGSSGGDSDTASPGGKGALLPISVASDVAHLQHQQPLMASPRRRGRIYAALGLGFIALGSALAVLSIWSQQATPPAANFITVQGTRFMDGCRPFFVAGFNVDNVVEAAIPEVSSHRRLEPGNPPSGRQLVRQMMATAAASGLNVMRTWAHTTDPAHPLQERAGVYSEGVIQALDYVIAEAGAAGLRVGLSLVDTWKYRGGIGEFVDWSSTVPKRDPAYPPLIVEGDVTPDMMTPERKAYESRRSAHFFTDPECRAMYKAHMHAVLTRRNVFTGRRYLEDPAILSFGLINELRCEAPGCGAAVQAWVEDMAAHFRSLDTNHLLTLGSEGFWGPEEANRRYNPGDVNGTRWASETGQVFVDNHRHVDYATVHLWPDNWDIYDPTFHTAWLERHTEDAERALGKPLLLEEVGRKMLPAPASAAALASARDPVFRTVYAAVEKSIAEGRALAGSLFWEWNFKVYEASPFGPYGVAANDSTFHIIQEHSQRVAAFAAGQPPAEGCGGECWVGGTAAFGLLRRCERRPAVCAAARGKAAAWDEKAGVLAAPAARIYSSKVECCHPGEHGAFAAGCSHGQF